MSVSIRPNHTRIGVPQWRHTPAHRALGQTVPDMSGLTLSADGEYDISLPDSVWLTIYEDLGEHFARQADRTSSEAPWVRPCDMVPFEVTES